jgi:hypothetical protein
LFSKKSEEESIDDPIPSTSKGKEKESRPPSTDIHSPREPAPLDEGESDTNKSNEEQEEEIIPPKRVATPMPGHWGKDLEEVAISGQLEEVVKVALDDLFDPEPEYGQLPRNTNAAARAIFKAEPPGTTPTISHAALGGIIGVNKAFVPTFGQPSLGPARIATTSTTGINPVYAATKPFSRIAKALAPTNPTGGSGTGGGGGGSGGGGGGSGGGGGGGGSGGGGGGRGPTPAAAALVAGHSPNGGLKGNPPTVFTGDRSKSNQFLKEFRIYRLSN